MLMYGDVGKPVSKTLMETDLHAILCGNVEWIHLAENSV
jgi:hypothetical protein